MDFYTKLYSQEVRSLQSIADRDMIFERVTSRFTPEMSLQLQRSLSKEELHMALLNMAKGHSPGPDGVTMKFFCKFWDLIGHDFFQMVQESITHGHLPLGMTSGTITLIFKAGDHADLSIWRPITLFNVSYKIVAKAL